MIQESALDGIGDLVAHMHRLADAAETIAACMAEERQRRQAGERTELAYLRHQAEQASRNFYAAETRMATMTNHPTEGDRQWQRESEALMWAARDRLAAYEAAHPWITDEAEAL